MLRAITQQGNPESVRDVSYVDVRFGLICYYFEVEFREILRFLLLLFLFGFWGYRWSIWIILLEDYVVL